MADTEARTPNGFLVFLGSAAAIIAVIFVFGALLAKRPEVETVDAKRAQERIATREKLDQAADQQLATADWLDKEKGTVRLPIHDAMKLVTPELSAKKAVPSQVKVDAPLPMPPPYDPNSKEAPISALPSAPQGADLIRFDGPAQTATPPVSPTEPQPAAPQPAAPPAAAHPSPDAGNATASAAPGRPPLIHFSENSETKK